MGFRAEERRRSRVLCLVGQRELRCSFLGGDYGLELVDTGEAASEFGAREGVRRRCFSYLRLRSERRGGLRSRVIG